MDDACNSLLHMFWKNRFFAHLPVCVFIRFRKMCKSVAHAPYFLARLLHISRRLIERRLLCNKAAQMCKRAYVYADLFSKPEYFQFFCQITENISVSRSRSAEYTPLTTYML